jgi:uncharacterized protein (UPF0335 family)
MMRDHQISNDRAAEPNRIALDLNEEFREKIEESENEKVNLADKLTSIYEDFQE